MLNSSEVEQKKNNDYISFHKPAIGNDEINEVVECLKSGWLTTGLRTKRFEEEFAKYTGAKFAVALNSCTAALHLALEAIGLRQNDIVIIPTMTFAATAEVVRYFDAIPVFVDSLESDYCMNMDALSVIIEKIQNGEKVKGLNKGNHKIKAVIPVHFGGRLADSMKCNSLKAKHGFMQIEDCAHICPAYFRNENGNWAMGGSRADIACYSFYANKTITTGEGGMAVTNNNEWAERIRIMSLHGISKDSWKRFSSEGSWFYEIIAPGYKYNMTDIAAALGLHQLKKADYFFEQRRIVAEKYGRLLKDSEGVEIPPESQDIRSSWHLYAVRVRADIRNKVIDFLKERKIGTSVHYIPLHMHPYYRDKFGFVEGDFPVAEKLYRKSISLPIYPGLSDSEIERVALSLKEAVKKFSVSKP